MSYLIPRSLSIYTEELPPEWEWSPDSYVGGTHEFIINTAKCAPFEEVTVFYDGPPGSYDNVLYLPRSEYCGDDVVLACNSVPHELGDYNIYWSNWHHNRDREFLQFDECIVLSQYHQKVFGDISRIVPHSLWPDQFKDPVKVKNRCLYSSSPDRGGKFLDEIWPDIEKETGAKLIKTYDKNISEQEMIDLYKTSQYWLHPCQGVELFCIAAAKAQLSGCIPVVVPNMALDTTVKYGVRTTLENFAEDLIKAIRNPPKVEKVDFGTWQTVTDQLFENVR